MKHELLGKWDKGMNNIIWCRVPRDFEGVSYLEEKATGEIYNMKHENVGRLNEDGDDIIWVSDDFLNAHENSIP
jgi:hypothetical protein